jgi:hypothetical protein
VTRTYRVSTAAARVAPCRPGSAPGRIEQLLRPAGASDASGADPCPQFVRVLLAQRRLLSVECGRHNNGLAEANPF